MSKPSRKPLPLHRPSRVSLTAVRSKCGHWLKNVLSTSAHANWRGKNNLQPFRPNNTQPSTKNYEHTKSEWIHAAVSRKRLDQEPLVRGKTKSNRSMDGLVQKADRSRQSHRR